MKLVKVTVEHTMELPDGVELVDVEDCETALAIDGRYFSPFDIVWEERDQDGSYLQIVENDDAAERLLHPVGSKTTIANTIEQVG